MGDRCTGHCCERFYLPWTPAELKRRAKDHPDDKQLNQVAEMVIFLEYGTNKHSLRPGQHFGNWYTCKNFDTKTRGCTIYETRPDMCREYPYSEPCDYNVCEWDDGRNGAYPYHDYTQKMLTAAKRCLENPEDERFDVFYRQSRKLSVNSEYDIGLALKQLETDLKVTK